MRTANDFNREFEFKLWQEYAASVKKITKGSIIRSTIFYIVLVSAVLFSFIWSGSKDPGKRFGPFAYNTVLTGSMNSVYPQGSLVTSWAIKPADTLKAGLENGDDIVFAKDDDGTVIVHRIIEIFEDYEDSGQRGFRTQGVNNPGPDTFITYEANVIGRVTWHVPYAGNVLSFISDNLLWFIAGIAGIFALLALFKIIFKKEK